LRFSRYVTTTEVIEEVAIVPKIQAAPGQSAEIFVAGPGISLPSLLAPSAPGSPAPDVPDPSQTVTTQSGLIQFKP
jgi:hypothetical protein